MAGGLWKGVYPLVLGRSHQLSLNKFFDLSAPSMRKVGVFSGRYVIANSRPPERRPLERRTLVPIFEQEIFLTR